MMHTIMSSPLLATSDQHVSDFIDLMMILHRVNTKRGNLDCTLKVKNRPRMFGPSKLFGSLFGTTILTGGSRVSERFKVFTIEGVVWPGHAGLFRCPFEYDGARLS